MKITQIQVSVVYRTENDEDHTITTPRYLYAGAGHGAPLDHKSIVLAGAYDLVQEITHRLKQDIK